MMLSEASEVQRKRIRIIYKGSFSDGRIFYDSTYDEPLEVTLGTHSLPEALEKALSEMTVGEERTVKAPKAYGDYDPSAVYTRIPRFEIAGGSELHEGMTVMWAAPVNRLTPIPVTVIREDMFTVDLDFNHPLAGEDLAYWIKLIEVND